MNVNEGHRVNISSSSINVLPNDTMESLKKTLQDPNTSLPDTMEALGKMYQMTSMNIKQGSASDDEKSLYGQIEALRSGNMPDADRDQLASQLGMSPDRMAEVAKQFKPREINQGNSNI